MAFSFPSFVFCWVWGPSPSHAEGHEICRWPLGRGGAGPPKPVGETWRRKRDGRTVFSVKG